MTPAEGPAETPAARRDDAGAGRGPEAVPGVEGAPGDAVTGRSPASRRAARGGSALVFDDPLYGPSPDDSDRGWGESFSAADDDFIRFLNEKPPHHI